MSSALHADIEMATLLKNYPGARRALFAHFHIGGCQSCAYQDHETLSQVCERNEIDLTNALQCLEESRLHDQQMLISPHALSTLLQSPEDLLLIDIRTREEHEAVTLPGSVFMTQENQTQWFAEIDPSKKNIVLFDHLGHNVLDQCAWFRGHGLSQTLGLDGEIDRYAQEIDSSLGRYRLELD